MWEVYTKNVRVFDFFGTNDSDISPDPNGRLPRFTGVGGRWIFLDGRGAIGTDFGTD